MTPEEFRSLLDTYGADLTLWPHQKRHQAHQLMQQSADARNAFAEAKEFDDLLRQPEPELSAGGRDALVGSIMDRLDDLDCVGGTGHEKVFPSKKSQTSVAIDARPVQPKGLSWFGVFIRPFAPLCALCFVCGLVIGAGVFLKSGAAGFDAFSRTEYLYTIGESEYLLSRGND